MNRDLTRALETLKPLIGGVIVREAIDRKGEFFGFAVRTPDGAEKIVWIDADGEGNGPGWLRVESKRPQDKPLHETERYAVRTRRGKTYILYKEIGEEYFWPAVHTKTILDAIEREGVERTCEKIAPPEAKRLLAETAARTAEGRG